MWAILGTILTLIHSAAYAEEPEVAGVSTARSHFSFVTFKCKPDKPDGPDSTAQSPPLDVDDPGTPGCKQWEINIVADGDLMSGQKNWELPLLDLNYGIGDNLQLKYEVPYVSQQGSEGNVSAIGEAKVGIKYMFYENEETDTQIAIYPQLSMVSVDPTAEKKSISTPGKIFTFPLLYTKKIGQNGMGNINLTANLGVNFSTKEDTSSFASAAFGVGVPVHKRIAWMAELSTEQAWGSDAFGTRQELVKVNTGLIGTITKNILLFASAGKSLRSSDDVNHNYVLAGMRLLSSNDQE
jgi:hypothetical protein